MKPVPESVVHDWLSRQNPMDLFTTAVTEAEIFYGVTVMPDGRRKRELDAAAQRILALFAGRILPFDSTAAREFALIVTDRRRAGRPIEDFDAQIAAIHTGPIGFCGHLGAPATLHHAGCYLRVTRPPSARTPWQIEQ
jgi:predicted nucleic acid-binding protein